MSTTYRQGAEAQSPEYASERLVPLFEACLEGHGIPAKKRGPLAYCIMDNLRAELSRETGDAENPHLILVVENRELVFSTASRPEPAPAVARVAKTPREKVGPLFDFAADVGSAPSEPSAVSNSEALP